MNGLKGIKTKKINLKKRNTNKDEPVGAFFFNKMNQLFNLSPFSRGPSPLLSSPVGFRFLSLFSIGAGQFQLYTVCVQLRFALFEHVPIVARIWAAGQNLHDINDRKEPGFEGPDAPDFFFLKKG